MLNLKTGCLKKRDACKKWKQKIHPNIVSPPSFFPFPKRPLPIKWGRGGRGGGREKGEGNSQKADLAKYDHGTKRVDKASSLVSLRAAVRRCCKKVGGVTKRNSPPPSQCQSYKTCSQRVFWMIKVYSCGDWINTWNRNSLRATGYTETAFHRGNAPNSKQPEVGGHHMCLPWSYPSSGEHLRSSLKTNFWLVGLLAMWPFFCSCVRKEQVTRCRKKCMLSTLSALNLTLVLRGYNMNSPVRVPVTQQPSKYKVLPTALLSKT